MIKKFQRLLLKNTLAVVGPAIAVFVVLSILLLRYPVFSSLECEDITGVADYNGRLEYMYEADTKLATYDAKHLYYSGYDYYIDGELKGAYYYSTDNGYMSFFIIETTSPESYIDEYTVKGEIIKDNISITHIVNKLVSTAGIKEELVENYYSHYVISELDYPRAYISLVYLLCISPAIACGLLIFYVILVIIFPAIHSQSKQLEIYGNVTKEIKAINYELKKNLFLKRENVYVTKNYLVVSYLLKTVVVKLDEVKYMSKNLTEKTAGKKGEETVYRLTISNPGLLFYEIDFADEDFIDEVVENIRGF
ncbi:MAG: hypothetical protein E7257_10670 [Lachnospiraceae bacterium]|nr:hypothetical protein [Lachnospiraceae bacterium]MBQ9934970.1 hypothetical protein [Lachnospiraceae bacterium]